MLYDGVLSSNATSNRDFNRNPLNNFEYTREKVSISWKNFDVIVKVPRPSLRKRLHLITEEQEKPTRKQVLYNRKYLFYLFISACLCKQQIGPFQCSNSIQNFPLRKLSPCLKDTNKRNDMHICSYPLFVFSRPRQRMNEVFMVKL